MTAQDTRTATTVRGVTITRGDQARIDGGRAAICPACRRVVSIRVLRGHPKTLRHFYPHGIGSVCQRSERLAPGWNKTEGARP